jgi:hypothetical protein
MTIQEAIKSGKPFRRESWQSDMYDQFVKVDYDLNIIRDARTNVEIEILVSDILATDWIIKDN